MNILMDQDFNVRVLLTATVQVAPAETGTVTSTGEGGEAAGGVPGDMMGAGGAVKDPLLSSWPFVIGITAATLAVSILLGLLLAKRKIKKGYELYED